MAKTSCTKRDETDSFACIIVAESETKKAIMAESEGTVAVAENAVQQGNQDQNGEVDVANTKFSWSRLKRCRLNTKIATRKR